MRRQKSIRILLLFMNECERIASEMEWKKMEKKRSHQPRDSSIAFVTFWLFKQTLNKLPKITDLFRGKPIFASN